MANPLIHLTKTAWHYAAGNRRRFVAYVALSALSIGVSLLEPVFIGRALNTLQVKEGQSVDLHSLGLYLGLYVLSSVVFWCLHGPSRVIERALAFRIKVRFQNDLFHRLVALPVHWHRDHHSGETIDQMQKATTSLNAFCDASFETIHIIARFVGALVALMILMPEAAFAVSSGTAITVVFVLLCDRVLIRQYDELNRMYHCSAAAVHDYLTNIITVISLRLGHLTQVEVDKRATRPFPLFYKNIVFNEVKWFVTTVLVYVVIAGVFFWYCSKSLAAGTLLVGTAYTLFDYLRRIGDSFFGFAWKYGSIVSASSKVATVSPIIRDFERLVGNKEFAALPSGWRHIQISELSFHHSDAAQPALQSIELNLRRGGRIALVGSSGSGKSTLLAVLRGLHEASATVSCDGQPLELGLLHVAHHVTLLPQDPEIFAESIRFNVCMGVECDDEEILWALKQARFASILPRLPQGLLTNIAEKGVNLSGGERQRLALARGIFFAKAGQSDIILLDESTSSVDLVNEQNIYRSILKQFPDACVVSSIHKLHLLTFFDEVLVLENGRIVEHGPFKYLLEQGGALSRLWAAYEEEQER